MLTTYEDMQGTNEMQMVNPCQSRQPHTTPSRPASSTTPSLFQDNLEVNNAWIAYLDMARLHFEAMTKAERAQAAGTLLRYTDWHATNSRDGYLLGHMGGIVSDYTAFLVAAMDEEAYQEEMPAPTITDGLWAEAERFMPMNPGSRRAAGKRVEPHFPNIMLFPKPIPSDLLTTGSQDELRSDADTQMHTPRKRHFLQVEISSGGSSGSSQCLRFPLGDEPVCSSSR